MNIRQAAKLMIAVLVVLSLTATVAAQNKQIDSTDAEKGESIVFQTEYWEAEPNNSWETANPLYVPYGEHAVSGEINTTEDEDWFALRFLDYQGLLVEIDNNSLQGAHCASHPNVCLYDHNRNLIACSTEGDGCDSTIYVPNCDLDELYYIQVTSQAHEQPIGPYVLSATEPSLVSPRRAGTIDGVSYDSSDILARTSVWSTTPRQEKWIKFFDASDMGITKNIVAFDTWHSCYEYDAGLAATFAGKQRITDSTGLTWKSTPYDVVSMEISQFGQITRGEFEPDLILDGSRVGLTTRGERIDAITWSPGPPGLLVSTVGSASVPAATGGDVRARDEDLIRVDMVNGIAQPSWSLWFDGSEEVPGLAKEDLQAITTYGINSIYWIDLLISGSGRLNGEPIDQKTEYTVYYEYDFDYQVEPLPEQHLGRTYPFEIDALD